MRTRTLRLLLGPVLVLGIAACGTVREPEQHEADPVPEVAESDRQDEATGHAHADPGDRDAWSRPDMLYDFAGIEEGDTVLDLMAGSGYNTLRLATRVGPTGKVISEGAAPELESRVASGELPAHIHFVGDLLDVEDGSVDAVVAVRAYHLFPDVPATLTELYRLVKPGGTVAIVEVRLDEPVGHDMTTHRMGEQTVIDEMTEAGFEYVGESEILRRDDDDYTSYRAGERHMTDRMLLRFRKPE